MKYFSFLFYFITIINLTISLEWCPTDCECKTDDNNRNQAKCTSIEGILKGKNLPIHSIILSNTNLTKISHLEKLRDLTEIDVSNNHLSDIDHLGRRIKILNLSNNKITSAKLTNIPQHVEHLNLSYNEITYLPLELTIKLKKLKTIELIGNKINCTCETLEVRNWLKSIHVSTDNFIKCSYPVQVKDLPWLQVKQNDLCNENHLIEHINDDNENELMLGDQPANDRSEEKSSNEELGKDFMPIVTKKYKKEIKDNNGYDEDIENNDDVEGSGGGSLPKMERLLTNIDNKSGENTTDSVDDDEDGSGGSGFGLVPIPSIIIDDDNKTDTNDNNDLFNSNEHENDTIPLISPMEESTTDSVFGPLLGVVQFASDETNSHDTTDDNDKQDEVSEPPIVPRVIVQTQQKPEENIINESVEDNGIETASNENYINEANAGNDENRGTYILLGIILLIVLGLIIFVAMKRIKAKRSNSNSYDPENPKDTELINMDKKNLGKPIQKNGGGNYENKPLIGDKNKEDIAKPINGNNNNRKIIDEPDNKIQEPLLNGLPTESNNNDTPQKDHIPEDKQIPNNNESGNESISPRTHSPRYGSYPLPKSPKSPSSPNSTGNNDEVFLPSSPRQGRYSPVYSPETGKVKIKLTETPKPKTPMLVTRSRSNAGDIITTKPTTADTVDNM